MMPAAVSIQLTSQSVRRVIVEQELISFIGPSSMNPLDDERIDAWRLGTLGHAQIAHERSGTSISVKSNDQKERLS